MTPSELNQAVAYVLGESILPYCSSWKHLPEMLAWLQERGFVEMETINDNRHSYWKVRFWTLGGAYQVKTDAPTLMYGVAEVLVMVARRYAHEADS